MVDAFSAAYPNLARWVTLQGWIEVGNDRMSPSLVRVLDEGGMIWQGGDGNESVDEVLRLADAAVERLVREEMGE